MDVTQVYVGQRIQVNVPGIGDHGQLGTIKKVRRNQCFVRLDWDQRLQHVVRFYATDLDPVPDEYSTRTVARDHAADAANAPAHVGLPARGDAHE